MTTGLLLEDITPPADGADDGPLGELRRRLTLLQGPQARPLPSAPLIVMHNMHSSGPWLLCLNYHFPGRHNGS